MLIVPTEGMAQEIAYNDPDRRAYRTATDHSNAGEQVEAYAIIPGGSIIRLLVETCEPGDDPMELFHVVEIGGEDGWHAVAESTGPAAAGEYNDLITRLEAN